MISLRAKKLANKRADGKKTGIGLYNLKLLLEVVPNHGGAKIPMSARMLRWHAAEFSPVGIPAKAEMF
jgi:hypothetical protein